MPKIRSSSRTYAGLVGCRGVGDNLGHQYSVRLGARTVTTPEPLRDSSNLSIDIDLFRYQLVHGLYRYHVKMN